MFESAAADTEVVKRETDGARHEETHDDGFTVGGWEGRDTDVDVLAWANENGEAAILWNGGQGEFESGDEFDAADDSVPVVMRDRCDVLEYAINAITDDDHFFFCFDVDVRGFVVDCTCDDDGKKVSDSDFLDFVVEIRELFDFGFVAVEFFFGERDAFGGRFDFWEGVIALFCNRKTEFGNGVDFDVGMCAFGELVFDFIECWVLRVYCTETDFAAYGEERDDFVVIGLLTWDEGECVLGNWEFFERDVFKTSR